MFVLPILIWSFSTLSRLINCSEMVEILQHAEEDKAKLVANRNWRNVNSALPNIPALDDKELTMDSAILKKISKSWCDYLQNSDEPDMIIYPRLPKAGSTTMDRLFELLSRKNGYDFISIPSEYWGDSDNFPEIQKYIQLHAKQYFTLKENKNSKVLIAGHIHRSARLAKHLIKYVRSNSNMEDFNIEYIQLMRDCTNRTLSSFYYTLQHCRDAVRASEKGKIDERVRHFFSRYIYYNSTHKITENTTIDEIVHQENVHLQKSMSFDFNSCLNDPNCVRSFSFDYSGRNNLNYLCGRTCIEHVQKHFATDNDRLTKMNEFIRSKTDQDSEFLTKLSGEDKLALKGFYQEYGAYLNAVTPDEFTVMGTLEFLPEYLEMLECAYPTILNGIVDMYEEENVHGNSHAKSNAKTMSSVLIDVVDSEVCSTNDSAYRRVYDSLVPLFRYKYQYMKQNRNSCCRRRSAKRIGYSKKKNDDDDDDDGERRKEGRTRRKKKSPNKKTL